MHTALSVVKAFFAGGFSAARTAAKSTYTLTTLAASDWWRGVRASLGWGTGSYATLARLAAESPYGSRGLRLIAQAAADVPLVVYDEDDEEVEGSAGLRLLKRPGGPRNRAVTWGNLVEAAVWGLYCGGELFVEKLAPATGRGAGVATRLRWWRPDHLAEIKRDDAGDPTLYVFTGWRGRRVEVEADRVLHLRTYDPLGDPGEDRGCALLLGARRALVSLAEGDDWNRALAASGGRIEGFFKPNPSWLSALGPNGVPTEQRKQAQALLDDEMRTSTTRGRWHVLSGAYEPVPASLSPRDADWIKGALQHVRAAACVLGVPATLLADEKAGSLTDAGVDSEVAALLKLTVLPLLRLCVLDPLSAFLLPDGERFAVDTDDVEALQEDVDAKYERVGKAVALYKVLTREEGREMLGWDAVPKVGEFAEAPPALVPPAVSEDVDEAEDDPGRDGSAKGVPILAVPLADRVAKILAGEGAY